MSIKLVVFDMAGTTVEDRDFVHQALMDALADENVMVTRDDVNEVMGYPKPVAIARLLNDHNSGDHQPDEPYVMQIHDNFVNRMIRFYQEDPAVKSKKGAEETFAKLKEKGIKVALDTGFDRQIANAILKRLGWENGMIDLSVASDEVDHGRPYPDMIFKAMELANIPDAEMVMKIGDTLSDLQEGKAAGCRYVVGVTTGAFKREELMNEYHTHLIEELPEVLEIV